MRFEKQHAKSVNASAKFFQEEEERDEAEKMLEMRREEARRVESSCLLTDVNKASHKLSAKRAERQLSSSSSSKQRQLHAATCGKLWQLCLACYVLLLS